MHGVRKGDNSLEGNKWRKRERERVIRVEHGKRALISQLYWRKKRVRPAWTSIVGRRPLLSLCIIAFRSYRLERETKYKYHMTSSRNSYHYVSVVVALSNDLVRK